MGKAGRLCCIGFPVYNENMNITIAIPQTQFVNESAEQVAAKFKLFATLGMYQAGMLSIGAACELVEVNIYDFHALLKHHGIPLKTQSPEEFAAERINNLMIKNVNTR